MTEQGLVDLCDGEPELAHTRMTIEKQTFGAHPQQVAQIIDDVIERVQPSDAEVRLRPEVSPGASASDSGLLNGPETYQMRVPSFAETPFRFMGMTF